MGVEPSQHSCVLCVSGLGGVVDSQALRDAAESMRSLEKLSTSITCTECCLAWLGVWLLGSLRGA